MNLEQPKIDVEKLQKKANEAAEKAYLNEIEEFYNSYNSPYRKAIKDELAKKGLNNDIELPDILGRINTALAEEMDRLANNALSETYIPILSNALDVLPKRMKMSGFLKKVIEDVFDKYDDSTGPEDYNFYVEKNKNHGWYNAVLVTPEHEYNITLHTAWSTDLTDEERRSKKVFLYCATIPDQSYNNFKSPTKMTLYKDDVKLEMPFTHNIIQDKTLNVLFKLVLGKTIIELDTGCFDDDWFPQDECSCTC